MRPTALMVLMLATGCDALFPTYDGPVDGVTGALENDGVTVSELRSTSDAGQDVVSGVMEAQFTGVLTVETEATHDFRLPQGSVVTGAEILLPEQERWERAETLGRREGQAAYEEIVEPRPSQDPLLLQRIGPDLYRARVYPVTAARPLQIRVHYAHLAETPAPVLTALAYHSPAAAIPDHLYVGWQPDFSAYPTVAAGPRNVVFVIDVSGSMTGTKLVEAQNAVLAALDELVPEDSYDLVAFSATAEAFRPEMMSGADTTAAHEWVRGLRAQDSTDMSAGLTLGATVGATSSAADPTVDLLFVTDGRPTAGDTELDTILADVAAAAAESGRTVRIFVCGLGVDVDQAFLVSMAASTSGEAIFALADEKIEEQITTLFERVRGGGASAVEVRLEAAGLEEPAVFTWPRVFPGQALAVAARGTFASSVTVSLTGTTPEGAAVSLVQAVVVEPSSSGESLLAPPLAASAWAQALEREIDHTLESSERLADAVVLAKTYGIVSRYSSLLALEDNQMYVDAGIERLERDPAGVALSPVSASIVDESRIGGNSAMGLGETAVTQPGDCSAGGAPQLVWGLLALLLLRRGRAGDRRHMPGKGAA